MKLIRLIKYNRSMSRILQIRKMNQGVKRMISVAITMFFLVHLMGCLFFLIARLDDFSPQSWVVRFDKLEESAGTQYLFSVGWALQTLTTVGYGDINAYLM